jgi:hypothetical protein
MRGEQPRWLNGLKSLVSMRVASRTVPPDLLLSLLQSVIEEFDCVTNDHGGFWNADAWRSGFSSHPRGREQLDVLAASLPQWPGTDPRWRLITRGDVFASNEPLLIFLAAMAWGFGPTGYGWRRTLDILTAAGDDAVVNAMRTLQRAHSEGGPEAVWKAFSADGTAKVNGLGTAFASKIAYFTCYDRQRGAGPLIADRNTAWAFWALADVWDSRTSATLYARYVAAATEWAMTLSSRPDDVERALFVLGPHVRAICNELP